MEISVKMVVALVLALVVILGVVAALTTGIGQGGNFLKKSGSNFNDGIDCALTNPDDARGECATTSSAEVEKPVYAT